MSLLKQIQTSDNRSTGWESTQTRYIYEIHFSNRNNAKKSLEQIKPFYNKIWATGTWDGIKQTSKTTPDYAQTSMHSHIWIDENQMGFSLCISFTYQNQRNEIKKSLDVFFKESQIKLHVTTLNESERKRIDHLETATHSVEIDVSNTVFTLDVMTDFMNVAMTAHDDEKALYVDSIGKDGSRRLKAYFASKSAAKSFSDVCDLKIRTPLLQSVQQPLIRSFPTVIPKLD